MDNGFDVHVEVVNSQKLDKLVNKIEDLDTPVGEFFGEQVDDMVTVAKMNCPTDTGRLRDSVHAEGTFPYYTVVADAVNQNGQHYAGWVEYGTIKMEPRPFIHNAVEAVRVDLPGMLKLKLKQYIKE